MSVGDSIEAVIRDQVAAEVAKLVRPDLSEAFAAAGRIEALKRRVSLEPEEVEEVYGYPVATLKAWRARGIGPAFVAGKPVRYRVSDLEAFQLTHRRLTRDAA